MSQVILVSLRNPGLNQDLNNSLKSSSKGFNSLFSFHFFLDSFSNNIGLAYQVQDDVLDVTTSDEVLGKKQNSDSVKNKPSYPAIIGVDESIKIFENLPFAVFCCLQIFAIVLQIFANVCRFSFFQRLEKGSKKRNPVLALRYRSIATHSTTPC